MGERISCSFQVGGKLTKAQAEELVQRANDNYSSDNNPIALSEIGELWFFEEISYGDLDELTDFCTTEGIDYEYWCDSGSEWDARKERWIGGVETSFTCGQQGEYILLDDLVNLDALSTGWAELHARIRRWKEPFPKAEIVG